jgi:hypothetical protein
MGARGGQRRPLVGTAGVLAPVPSLGVVEIAAHYRRESTSVDIGQGGVFEDIAHRGPKRHPHIGQVRGSAGVVDVLGTQLAHRRQLKA